MPTFATPEPIELRVKISAGSVQVDASQRTDTDAEVEPMNPSRSQDVEAAANTSVDFTEGRLVIEGPDQDRKWFGRTGEVRVRVALPEGSDVRASTASGDIRGTGRFGDTDLNTASGELSVEHVAALRANSASGDIRCRTVDGNAHINSASGSLTVDQISGRAEASVASGDIRLGEVGGDLQLTTASGDGFVEVAHGSVTGKTASGDLRIGRIEQGSVTANGASGDVYVGIATGTAAWLDVTSLSGDIVSRLDQADQPGDGDKTVEVRVRTLSGDVTIARA